MAMTFLRTKYGLIDLRQPLYIGIDPAFGDVLVMNEKPVVGAGGQIVAHLERKDGHKDGDSIPQLHAIADSLANAIAYANTYTAENGQDGTAWILSFEPVGDRY